MQFQYLTSGVQRMGASPSKQNASNLPASNASAAAAEPNMGQPLPVGVEAVFKNKIVTLMNFEIEEPALDDAPEVEADDSAAAASSGKAEEDEDVSAAGAVAAGASVAAAEKPVWLDFTPTPIRDDITPESIKRILALRHTNHFFREQSEPYINMLAEQLVALVLNGREDEAKKLIEACPFLLERRATVTDPVGRVYENFTAYQVALFAGDTKMCEMMHPFFAKHRGDGEAMRLAQCDNVFPEGVQAVIGEQVTYDFDGLIEAIGEASNDDIKNQLKDKITDSPLGQAINEFRRNFTTLSKQEQHANLKHLLEAFRAYAEDERIAAWEHDGNYEKMDVFWRQVIGFVQLFLPECDKQALHQGLYDGGQNSDSLSRESDFKFNRGYSLQLRGGSHGCGFDFAGFGGRRALGLLWPNGGMSPEFLRRWNLMSNKNIKLGKLIQPQTSRTKSCVIQ